MTQIKKRLLNRAVILFNYLPFQKGTSTEGGICTIPLILSFKRSLLWYRYGNALFSLWLCTLFIKHVCDCVCLMGAGSMTCIYSGISGWISLHKHWWNMFSWSWWNNCSISRWYSEELSRILVMNCTCLLIRVGNKWKLSYVTTKTYVVGTQKNRLNETILLSTHNTCFNLWIRK